MITLSNGHSFEFLAGAGALGFDGKGWPHQKILNNLYKTFKPEAYLDFKQLTKVSKTITCYSTKGRHALRAVRFIKEDGVEGVLNAIALRNPGVIAYKHRYAKYVKKEDKLILSIADYNLVELLSMIRIANNYDFVGVEYNFCPNVESALFYDADFIVTMSKDLKKECRHPLLLKLSYPQPYLRIAQRLEGVVEAINLNSILWKSVFPPWKKSPLEKFGGGSLSGKIIQPYNWEMAEKLEYKTSIPVIWSSIYDLGDIKKLVQKKREIMLKKGAPAIQAISFGSVFLRHFGRINSLIEAWKKIQEPCVVPKNSPVYPGEIIV